MHFNASRSLTHSLLDCMLYPTQYLYDPGTLPSSANQCILGNVYLRSNLSRKRGVGQSSILVHNNEAMTLHARRELHNPPRDLVKWVDHRCAL